MEKGLKECPVCRSMCFSDMDVCYGCLHRFEKRGKVDSPQGGSIVFREDFEPDEPNALPPAFVQAGQGKKGVLSGPNDLGGEPGGPCYELALTVRIPQELLRALRTG